jgi:hypothetical protein
MALSSRLIDGFGGASWRCCRACTGAWLCLMLCDEWTKGSGMNSALRHMVFAAW